MVLAVAAAAALIAVASPRTDAATASVRVMPLGDSLTGGPGCWRAMLWTQLQNAGYTGVDFVGSLPGGGCDVAVWDGDNEGHGGYLAIDTANQNLLPGWLSTARPDVVMMTFGTNDVWNARPTGDIITAFSTLVDQMRQSNPAMRILVAKIPPVAPPGCTYCQQGTIDLNNAVPGWAEARTTPRSPITVVDQWTGWDPATDAIDGVHQSTAGNQKMAARWYTALTPVLTRAPTPTSTAPGPTQTQPQTPTPSPTGTCSATYAVVGSWPGGFQARITVTAGAVGVSRWTVDWPLDTGQSIGRSWGATVSTSGTTATATNLAWNGALGASAGTTFGFLSSAGTAGSIPIPPVTCTAS